MNNLNKRTQSYLTRYVFLFICSVLYNLEANTSNFSLSGHVDFTYISRLSDQSIINLPYRIFNLNIDHQNGDLMLRSTIALEHKLRKDTYFLSNDSPTDFELDMREFFMREFRRLTEKYQTAKQKGARMVQGFNLMR